MPQWPPGRNRGVLTAAPVTSLPAWPPTLVLQPLAVDWRAKAKKGSTSRSQSNSDLVGTAAAAAATQPDATAAASPPDLEALSATLPEGWRAMWDATHARVYYGNLTTKVRDGGE